MSNPFKGETGFEIGGRSYTLLLDINGLCELEAELDLTFDVILAQYALGTSVKLVRALMWAGLRAHHPCTMQEAGALIGEMGFVAAKELIERALVNAMPEAETENPPKRGQAEAAAGTGSGS